MSSLISAQLSVVQTREGVLMIVALLLALILAAIIASSRRALRKREAQAAQDLNALATFHRLLLSEHDPNRVLSHIIEGITSGDGQQRFGIENALFYLYSPTSHNFEKAIGSSIKGPIDIEGLRLPVTARGLLKRAVFAESGSTHSNELGPTHMPRSSNTTTIAMPILGTPPAGAIERCWAAPERCCTVTPRASTLTREELCPRCPNFVPLGVLTLEYAGKKPHKDKNLDQYVRAIAVAVQNAKLYADMIEMNKHVQRQLEQLRLIHELGKTVTRPLEVETVLEQLARGLCEQLSYQGVVIALLDRENLRVQEHLSFMDGSITRPAPRGDKRAKIDLDLESSNPFAVVCRDGVPLFLHHTEDSPDWLGDAQDWVGGQWWAYVPIPLPANPGEQSPLIFGVLAARCTESDGQPPEDLDVLTTLCIQVGTALSHAEQFQTLSAQERDARLLAEMGQTLTRKLDDPTWLGAFAETCASFAGAERVTILSNQDGTTRTLAYFAAHRHRQMDEGEQTPHFSEEFNSLSLPLKRSGQTFGQLNFERGDPWKASDETRLAPIARNLTLALENSTLYESLRSEREQLADMIEHLTDGVLLIRPNGTGIANLAAQELLGLGETFLQRDLPDQLLAALEQGNGNLKIGEKNLQLAIIRRKQLSAVILQDLARALELEQARAELLSVVSHELRTPLSAIIGFATLLRSGSAGPLTPDQEEFLVTMLDESQRLHQTVLNLLDASRLEAGQFELKREMVSLDFSPVLERFERLATAQGLAFAHTLTPITLFADPARLSLVLANLLSNAIRYTASGSVHVCTEVQNNELHLSVSDTGSGMNEAEQATLFSRFARGSHNQKAIEGAGLSLYVSRAIVVAHGGRIWVQSVPAQGTTLHVTLPLPTNIHS